ncbi:GatB/YqeY domain-containing protein [Candidatus Nomurabacteria bacterium]|nr:GatB/YqeY domain-containing protein [Candidatus Nomurabacteria bacterium]
MTLQEQIREKLKEAMKDKDQTALDTLRAVLAGCTNELVAIGKTPQDSLDDAGVQKVIGRLVKQRKDSIDQFTSAGRADLVAGEQAQLYILEEFMPDQMSEEKIRAIAVAKQTELGHMDKSKIGVLIGAVMKEVGSTADGAVVKKVVESLF